MTAATPLTRISVGVTPGWSTGGNLPFDATFGVPGASVAVVDVCFDDRPPPVLAFEHAASVSATSATTAPDSVTRIGPPPRSIRRCRAGP